jgi:hypothetical protein
MYLQDIHENIENIYSPNLSSTSTRSVGMVRHVRQCSITRMGNPTMWLNFATTSRKAAASMILPFLTGVPIDQYWMNVVLVGLS